MVFSQMKMRNVQKTRLILLFRKRDGLMVLCRGVVTIGSVRGAVS